MERLMPRRHLANHVIHAAVWRPSRCLQAAPFLFQIESRPVTFRSQVVGTRRMFVPSGIVWILPDRAAS